MNTTQKQKPFDDSLYSARTTTLERTAKEIGADLLIKQKTDVIYEVGNEKITNRREALIFAIERKRKGGKAK